MHIYGGGRAPVLLVLVALAAAGCTSTTSSFPTASTRVPTSKPPTRESTPTSAAAGDPLANTDPCTLLDPATVSKNKFIQAGPETGPDDRTCIWNKSPDGDDPGYVIAINIYDNAGLDQLVTAGDTITDNPIGRHQGRLLKDNIGGACTVSIGITGTARVDIFVVDAGGRQAKACATATAVAPSIEQRVSAAGG